MSEGEFWKSYLDQTKADLGDASKAGVSNRPFLLIPRLNIAT